MKTLLSTIITLFMLSLCQDVEAATMKIAYKKPIFGKINTTRERRYRLRPDLIKKSPMNTVASVNAGMSTSASSPVGSTMPTLPHSLAPTQRSLWATTTPLPPNAETESVEPEAKIYVPELEKPLAYEDATQSQHMVLNKLGQRGAADETLLPHISAVVNNTLETAQLHHSEQAVHEIGDNVEAPSKIQGVSNAEANADIEELFPLPQPELLIAPPPLEARTTHTKAGRSSKKSVTTTTTTTESSRPIPCTCGIFLTSQIKRGSNEQPEGAPVITNELDRTFACNAVGQKQCQTKCLETVSI